MAKKDTNNKKDKGVKAKSTNGKIKEVSDEIEANSPTAPESDPAPTSTAVLLTDW